MKESAKAVQYDSATRICGEEVVFQVETATPGLVAVAEVMAREQVSQEQELLMELLLVG